MWMGGCTGENTGSTAMLNGSRPGRHRAVRPCERWDAASGFAPNNPFAHSLHRRSRPCRREGVHYMGRAVPPARFCVARFMASAAQGNPSDVDRHLISHVLDRLNVLTDPELGAKSPPGYEHPHACKCS